MSVCVLYILFSALHTNPLSIFAVQPLVNSVGFGLARSCSGCAVVFGTTPTLSGREKAVPVIHPILLGPRVDIVGTPRFRAQSLFSMMMGGDSRPLAVQTSIMDILAFLLLVVCRLTWQSPFW